MISELSKRLRMRLRLRRNQNVKIRKAKLSDAKALAALSRELGYATPISKMKKRLTRLASRLDQVILVAETNRILGWVHACAVESVESDPYAEVRGMVVAETQRGSGIGTLLLSAAEQWARQRGFARVRVRTNVKRTLAIEFYRKRGYLLSKTQNVYDKKMEADNGN